MSFEQFREFYALNLLHSQVRRFGLNPSDWRLRAESVDNSLNIEMVHKDDQNFRFNADLNHSEKGELKINQLTLVSL